MNKWEHIKNFLLIAFLHAVICLTVACTNKAVNEKSMQADSLLTVLYNIQDTISSPEVQVLYDIRLVMSNDLATIYDSMYEDVINSPVTTRYASLFTSVESCIKACGEYNEEIFMLESELQDLKNDIDNPDMDIDSIDKKIVYESELLREFKSRIDTNLDKIARYTKLYRQLKPEMDSLLFLSLAQNNRP